MAFSAGKETMSSALPDAENYHRWILDLLLPIVHGTVLEIGFGYGQYTREIAKQADNVIAVDIEATFVEEARSWTSNIHPLREDVAGNSFVERIGSDSCDAAVCLNVLEHIEN
ncbi:MAG: methyltransferase domain-containing protein, partial [Proteobacteria bacterium]|nr:methyltransferase domain-containing protein [Pseudomonadota bacterium]